MLFPVPASVRIAASPAAHIRGAGGYCLEGDQVLLNADLEWVQPGAAHASDWALQLWAWPTDAAFVAEATKIAEVPLAQSTADAARNHVEAATAALPPAGTRTYTVVLALSAGCGGVYDTVHDLLVFPRSEQFLQPHFDGPVGYAFDGDSVRLQAARVLNPRGADNLSGNLSLELWALDAPYAGGAFAGYRVGSSGLGRLAGQSDWHDVRASAMVEPLPPGSWSLTLMLREWTGPAGWVTRDYANFPLTHEVAAQPAPPVSIAPVDTEAVAVLPEPVAAVNVAHDRAQANKADAGSKKPAKAKAPPKDVTARAGTASFGVGDGVVSINRASETELNAIKGLTKALAKGIVAGRPYRSIDALIEVKGMGKKLLAKLRPFLGL